MKRTTTFGVLALCLWGMAGCGGETLCQRADRTNVALADKGRHGGCSAPRVYNVDSCETRSSTCSDRDRQLLETSFECLRPLQCEAFKDAEFEDAVRECRTPLRDVSADCPLVVPFL